MGEYQPGADAQADEAIARMPALRKFLQQRPDEFTAAGAASVALMELVAGNVHV